MEPSALRTDSVVDRGSAAPRRLAGLGRFALIGVPILLVLLVACYLGLRAWLDGFLQSDAFRRFVDAKVSNVLRTDCRLEPLHWQGSEIFSAGMDSGPGADNSPWKSVSAEQIRAELNLRALWSRVWRVDTLEIARARGELGRTPPPNVAPNATASTSSPANPQAAQGVITPSAGGGSWLANFLPNRFEIGEIRLNDLTLNWAAGEPGAAGGVENLRLTAQPREGGRSWEIAGHGGRLTEAALPPVALDHANAIVTTDEIFITNATGRPEPGGQIDFSGKQGLNGDRALDVMINFTGVPVDSFLPVDWRGRLQGKATGTSHVTGASAGSRGWSADGHLELREGRLEALPMLDALANFTSTARYRQAVVQQGSADYTWTPGTLTVSHVVLESEGLLRLEGGFTVQHEQIDGQFRVGVAATAVHFLAQAGINVFNDPQHDGYVWTTMHISGPVGNPHEDLTARLLAAAQKELTRKAKQGTGALIDSATDLLNLLHTP